MKSWFGLLIRRAIAFVIRQLASYKVGRFALDEVGQNLMGLIYNTTHHGVDFEFAVPNLINYFRASTFSIKEPETLEWIDSIPEGAVLWDIGANVGLYSIYAAKMKGCKVFAFEPSVFNLELLARNIYKNKVADKVTIVPLPLSDSVKRSTLNMASVAWGGALSTFAENYGYDGKQLDKIFEVPLVGLNMDHVHQNLYIPRPDYIKLDVDGIEQLILAGGPGVLKTVQGVLVEVDDNFKVQDDGVNSSLIEAGLRLKEKRHGEMFDRNSRYGNLFNQIWVR